MMARCRLCEGRGWVVIDDAGYYVDAIDTTLMTVMTCGLSWLVGETRIAQCECKEQNNE